MLLEKVGVATKWKKVQDGDERNTLNVKGGVLMIVFTWWWINFAIVVFNLLKLQSYHIEWIWNMLMPMLLTFNKLSRDSLPERLGDENHVEPMPIMRMCWGMYGVQELYVWYQEF